MQLQYNMAPAKKSNATNSSFNDDDRQQLKEINETMKKLVNEIRDLKSELAQNKEELKEIKMENAKLKQTLNVNIFSTGAINQYGRRTNIHEVPENTTEKDDGEKIVKKVVKEIARNSNRNCNGTWHITARLGCPSSTLPRKNTNSTRKPRPIIARFLNYKTRTQFLKEKSKLKRNQKFPNTFPTEDLTPLRTKLFHYLKDQCDDDFVMCHTLNGIE